jgi:predicted nucleotidyltransferase component of viral defense system
MKAQLDGFEDVRVHTYSLESTVAEKLDVILQRFELTSRMKDFYDIWYISTTFNFDGRQYYQVTYLLASKEVVEREYRVLKSIKDAYPKTVLAMDRIPIGVDDGIRHKNLVDFLLGK